MRGLAVLVLLLATVGCPATPLPEPPITFPEPVEGPLTCPEPTVRVASAAQLQAALDAARPGDVIAVADGVYPGRFVARTPGTAQAPVFLCGSASVVLQSDGPRAATCCTWTGRRGRGGRADRAERAGGGDGRRRAAHGAAGADRRDHRRRGRPPAPAQQRQRRPGLHHTTGLRRENFGEGVYVGTAVSNWSQVTDGEPDRSDRNQVLGNRIRDTTAEAVDVKEGTTGGLVHGNTFDGSRLSGADSWVDVKGNDWVVSGNVGAHSPADGFQTHEVAPGWGRRATFVGNTGTDLARTDPRVC